MGILMNFSKTTKIMWRKHGKASKKSTSNINKLIENGKEITDPFEMADVINKFYVNIGKTVEEKIPKGNKTFLHYLSNRNAFNIVLNPCSID